MQSDNVKPLRARKVNTNRIVHNDLELGPGTVTQRRSLNVETEERQIELCFIFRTVEEIRFLDTERYTRVALHTEGPLIEYRYDPLMEAVDDGEKFIAPHTANHMGRWVRVDYVDHEARRMIQELQEQLNGG